MGRVTGGVRRVYDGLGGGGEMKETLLVLMLASRGWSVG